ncbi:MAG: MFS transporter [Burkholderiales bacterium]
MAQALGYPQFRRLWTSSLLSWGSQWIQQAALGWVVYEATGSGALVGTVLGVRAIPMFLLAPISGVAADRYPRRRLLQASHALAAVVSFAIGGALALGVVGIWMLVAFTLLMGASNVIDRPARFSSAFDLVPREVAVKAIALNTIGFSLMRIIGPAIAGYLIAAVGAAGCFLIQGALYAASALMVLAVVFPPPRPRRERSALADMQEVLRYAAAHRAMRVLIALGALPYLLLIPVWNTLFPIYAKDEFAAGPQGLGLLLTAVGAGGTLGGVIANALARVEHQALIQAAWVLLMASAIIGIAASPTLLMAATCGFIAGIAEMAHTASNMATVQMAAPETMRGRVASLTMLYPAMISTGSFIAGPLADLVGVRAASATLAATAIAAVIGLYFLTPQIREMRIK